jgi:hypothetical protein
MDSVGVRNVHHERHEEITELFLQAIGVSLLAYRTEHAKSLGNKHLCGSPTNSGGDPGDHDISAVRHRISPEMITGRSGAGIRLRLRVHTSGTAGINEARLSGHPETLRASRAPLASLPWFSTKNVNLINGVYVFVFALLASSYERLR